MTLSELLASNGCFERLPHGAYYLRQHAHPYNFFEFDAETVDTAVHSLERAILMADIGIEDLSPDRVLLLHILLQFAGVKPTSDAPQHQADGTV